MYFLEYIFNIVFFKYTRVKTKFALQPNNIFLPIITSPIIIFFNSFEAHTHSAQYSQYIFINELNSNHIHIHNIASSRPRTSSNFDQYN
jgi:hypothetical protein